MLVGQNFFAVRVRRARNLSAAGLKFHPGGHRLIREWKAMMPADAPGMGTPPDDR